MRIDISISTMKDSVSNSLHHYSMAHFQKFQFFTLVKAIYARNSNKNKIACTLRAVHDFEIIFLQTKIVLTNKSKEGSIIILVSNWQVRSSFNGIGLAVFMQIWNHLVLRIYFLTHFNFNVEKINYDLHTWYFNYTKFSNYFAPLVKNVTLFKTILTI